MDRIHVERQPELERQDGERGREDQQRELERERRAVRGSAGHAEPSYRTIPAVARRVAAGRRTRSTCYGNLCWYLKLSN